MTPQEEIDMLVTALYAIVPPVYPSGSDAYFELLRVRELAKQALRNRSTGIPYERRSIV